MLKKKATKAKVAKAATSTTTKVTRPAPAAKPERRIVPSGTRAITKANDWEAMAGGGQERMTMSDFAIPRLVILQALSPQCNKKDARYIEGAEAGDICDTVTGVLFSGSGGIVVLPISYRKTHIEWIPRKKGGGFVADHDSNAAILEKCDKDENGNFVLPNGHEIKIIGEYFIFVIEDGEAQRYVLSMGGTQLKKSRRWNTIINQYQVPSQKNPGTKVNPPMWFRSYKLTTIPEQNEKGNWFGWVIEPGENTFDLANGQDLFQQATEFHLQVRKGQVTARPPVAEDEVVAGRDGDAGDAPTDDDIPY